MSKKEAGNSCPVAENAVTFWCIRGGIVLLFLVALYRTAWIGDDAYISFRVIDNFLHGYGLRWNVSERVQVFTHPFWLWVNMGAVAITQEFYYTCICVSIFLSVAAIGVFAFTIAKTTATAVLCGTIFLCSRSFVEFGTSGLENPLTHLLLFAFVIQYQRRSLFGAALLAGLLGFNRLDTLLLVLPALVYLWYPRRSIRSTLIVLAGISPVVLWFVFSIVYYGYPLPNTALAKLCTGIDGFRLAGQGINYLYNCVRKDLITAVTIVVAAATAVKQRKASTLVLASGIVLYVLYIIKVGGDFMSGRFLAAPLVMSVCIISTELPRYSPRILFWGILPVIGLGLCQPNVPLLSGEDYTYRNINNWRDRFGIADERSYYYPVTGLLRHLNSEEPPSHEYIREGLAYRAAQKRIVVEHGSVGFRGFYGGPSVHIIDHFGLADPLLSRLEIVNVKRFRIGHFGRALPEGYFETVETGDNSFADAKLGKFYEKLTYITQGPLWHMGRWGAIWKLNTGAYDDLLHDYTIEQRKLHEKSPLPGS
ncbi:MAG: hypothetical protein JXX29_03930 [Deltaproteobacteria bacterium]|nr:hypothetical protein [Deltaproteobacteria bacterium]MBN2670793.1 hypothetical protein [Deltaproteobacteria bacterium]